MVDGSDPQPAGRGRDRRGGHRRAVWVVATLVGVLAIALAIAILAYPIAAATICPRSYGLVALQENLYAERGLSGEQRSTVIATVADGTRLASSFTAAASARRSSSPA